MNRHYIIPIFVPHLGCPHDCVFCNQDRITNASTDVTTKDVEETIEKYLGYFDKKGFIEIAFYGGSFTAIDMDIQRELLKIAYRYKTEGLVDEIRLSTRPDCIDESIMKNLLEYDVDTIELGVQSMNNRVLNASGRGHDIDSVYKAVNTIKRYGIKFGLQMMPGLPDSNIYTELYTAKEFIRLDPDCVRIYPTLIIRETYLEYMYRENKYAPLSIDEAVDISTKILILFNINNINVIRIGLQNTENIQLGKDVIAGPFHPAFGQLVQSNIYKIILDDFLVENNINKIEEMKIYINNKKVSDLSGHSSSNIKYIKKNFNIENIKIYGNDMDEDMIRIYIDRDIYDIDRKIYETKYIKRELGKFNEFKLEDFNL